MACSMIGEWVNDCFLASFGEIVLNGEESTVEILQLDRGRKEGTPLFSSFTTKRLRATTTRRSKHG